MARFRAPSRSGEVLAEPGFDAIPALVEDNRRKLNRDGVRIGGLSLRELRTLARQEVLAAVGSTSDPNIPLLLAGHQPELSHPGVWVKNFALNGLARKLGGTPLNLIVDTDTLKSPSLRLPVLSSCGPKAHLESLAFDRLNGETPYEDRAVLDMELFRSFPDRAAPLWVNWGFEPLLPKVWQPRRSVGEAFTAMRCACERAWGCPNLELPVSRLSQSVAFAHFAQQILADLPRFREAYNAAIRAYRKANHIRSANHPAPELVEGEAPFWVRTRAGERERATSNSDVRALHPRALTLTLFTRVCLGDFFIHGIGGGKYDEVTDAIIRAYFGIEPPAYQILSATLHLPLPMFPTTNEDTRRAERRVRDLRWNAERCLAPEQRARPDVHVLVEEKRELAASEPPRGDRPARKLWFHELREIKEKLHEVVASEVQAAEAELAHLTAQADANAILQRRDYPWVLYPEETLRPFLQQFLEV